MQFLSTNEDGTHSLAITTPKHAGELYLVRPVIEALCDRFSAGVSFGSVQFALFLSGEAKSAMQEVSGSEFSVLSCSVNITKSEAKKLRDLGPYLNALPCGEPIADEVLKELKFPLPKCLPRHGFLAMSEAIFGFKSERSTSAVKGFSAMTIDLDLKKFLETAGDYDDPFGIRYTAAWAWCVSQRMPVDGTPLLPGKPSAKPGSRLGLLSYDEEHPLAGSILYETRFGRSAYEPSREGRAALAIAKSSASWTSCPETYMGIADRLLAILQEARIPPTCITFSGGGLHLRWRFANWIPSGLWPRVYAMQKTLHGLLVPFGSDAKVVNDRSRLFRLPGQRNDRTGSVAVRYRAQAHSSPFSAHLGKPLPMSTWGRRLLRNTSAEWHAIQEAADIARARKGLGSHQADTLEAEQRRAATRRHRRRNARFSSGRLRVAALLRLAESRKGIEKGCRNSFLYCAAQLIRSCLPAEERADAFGRFEKLVVEPLGANQMRHLRNGVHCEVPRAIYISNRYICDVLDVTPKELEACPELLPADARVAPYKRMAKRSLLIRLLETGTPVRVIASILRYVNHHSVHVMTSRLYASGSVQKHKISKARSTWQLTSLPVGARRQARANFLQRIRHQVVRVVDTQSWFEEALNIPGSPRASPDMPSVLGVLDRTVRCLQDITRSLRGEALSAVA